MLLGRLRLTPGKTEVAVAAARVECCRGRPAHFVRLSPRLHPRTKLSPGSQLSEDDFQSPPEVFHAERSSHRALSSMADAARRAVRSSTIERKKEVVSQTDLPRFSYAISGLPSDLVQADDAHL